MAASIMNALYTVQHGGAPLAIIVKSPFRTTGVEFVTTDEMVQQLGVICHPTGKVVTPHIHHPVRREIYSSSETLFIRSGKVRADFYTPTGEFVQSETLSTGDVVMFISGGHGFEMLEDTEMIEVKQGPYVGAVETTRLEGAKIGSARAREPVAD